MRLTWAMSSTRTPPSYIARTARISGTLVFVRMSIGLFAIIAVVKYHSPSPLVNKFCKFSKNSIDNPFTPC